MGRIIARLDEVDGTVLRQRGHALTGPASLHSAMVSGGDGWSTYAPQCTLRVERRTVPGERTSDVVAELTDVVRGVDGDAEVRVVMTREPLECDANAPIVQAVSAAAMGVTGRAPETCGVAYWMDAAVFAAAGIPTVNYGPGGEGAHAAVEWVDVDSVVRTAAVLADTARAFCV
jgi:acetylornithine deacetylase